MDRKKIFLFFCFLILSMTLFSIVKTITSGEEGKIKRIIFSAKGAVEKEDLLRLSTYISYNYHDQNGFDRQQILFLGQQLFNEYQDIALQIKDLEIEINKTDALAQMKVLGLARRPGETKADIPLEYDIIKLKVKFRKEEDSWKIIEIEFLESQELNFVPVA